MHNVKQFFKTGSAGASGLFLAVMLSACATHTGTPQAPTSPDVSAPPPPRVSESAPQGACDIDALGQAVGEQLTDERTQALQAESGARNVRVLTPDSVATMDYREDRLNIEVDETGRIDAFRCG